MWLIFSVEFFFRGLECGVLDGYDLKLYPTMEFQQRDRNKVHQTIWACLPITAPGLGIFLIKLF